MGNPSKPCIARAKIVLPAATVLLGFLRSGAKSQAVCTQDRASIEIDVGDFYANGVSSPRVDSHGLIDSTLGIKARRMGVLDDNFDYRCGRLYRHAHGPALVE
jgi:hypothetical protein